MSAERADNLPQKEIFDPCHLYAAYIFDQAETRKGDIKALIEKARELGYPVRYWWLSEAMDIQGYPDRLIVCVHHPSAAEDAGMDLFEELKEQVVERRVTWDELEAASVGEYRQLGRPVEGVKDIRRPDGEMLFPESSMNAKRLLSTMREAGVLFMITEGDVRDLAQERLGRELTDKEFVSLVIAFKKALEYLDWTFYAEEALLEGQRKGEIGPEVEVDNILDDDYLGQDP